MKALSRPSVRAAAEASTGPLIL